jgi:predicted MFS family arabinose efflux permease
MFTFAGAFATFTYLRPFLETYTRVSLPQLSLLLLGLGLAGFPGPMGLVPCLGDISIRCSADFRWLWQP